MDRSSESEQVGAAQTSLVLGAVSDALALEAGSKTPIVTAVAVVFEGVDQLGRMVMGSMACDSDGDWLCGLEAARMYAEAIQRHVAEHISPFEEEGPPM